MFYAHKLRPSSRLPIPSVSCINPLAGALPAIRTTRTTALCRTAFCRLASHLDEKLLDGSLTTPRFAARRWRSHREFDEIVIIRQFVSQDLTELAMNANLDALRAAERRSAVCCAWTWGKSPATGGIADPTTFGDQRLQQDQSNATLVQCG